MQSPAFWLAWCLSRVTTEIKATGTEIILKLVGWKRLTEMSSSHNTVSRCCRKCNNLIYHQHAYASIVRDTSPACILLLLKLWISRQKKIICLGILCKCWYCHGWHTKFWIVIHMKTSDVGNLQIKRYLLNYSTFYRTEFYIFFIFSVICAMKKYSFSSSHKQQMVSNVLTLLLLAMRLEPWVLPLPQPALLKRPAAPLAGPGQRNAGDLCLGQPCTVPGPPAQPPRQEQFKLVLILVAYSSSRFLPE